MAFKHVVVLVALGAATALAATCGTLCHVNTDCSSAGDCQMCMQGRCGSGCSGKCTADHDCRDSNCKFCHDGICGNSPFYGCGHTCKDNVECNQNGMCKLCVDGTCTAGCGQKCKNSHECNDRSCKHCVLGICTPDDKKCGQGCDVNLDCDQATVCNSCLAGKCGVGCGAVCAVDSQCIESSCRYCNSGLCSSSQGGRGCHESCSVNSDCKKGHGCDWCVNGKCGSPCGMNCKESSNCVTAGCTTCNATGSCSPP